MTSTKMEHFSDIELKNRTQNLIQVMDGMDQYKDCKIQNLLHRGLCTCSEPPDRMALNEVWSQFR